MNIKVSYRLAIFVIIIEILIFEIILMKARREKRSSRSRYSPVYQTLAAVGALEKQEREACRCLALSIAAHTFCRTAPRNSRWSLRDYNIMRQITVHVITL